MSKGKQNRKAALKAQEEARRLQEAKERRQQTMIGVIVTVVLIALIALGGFLYWRSHRPVKTEDLEQARQAVAKVEEKPSAANDQGGFLISSKGLGKPVAKAPTVEIYMDFMCPGCGALHRGLDSTLTGLVDAGQINLVIYPMSFMDRLSTDNYSTRTGTATIYVAQHDPEHLLPFIANLYAKDFQPDESDYHPVSNDKIRQQAIKAGVDPKVADQAVKGRYRAWIKAMDAYTPLRKELWNPDGSNKGQMTTPTVRINGNYWELGNLSRAGLDYSSGLLKALGLDQSEVGVKGAMPAIGASGQPRSLS
ncbi:DsbA family protein [Bifidobacterium choladohabitans]|uniref:DsbA family protein n=1 Tax=Bifidobacterium choladohabitans TaxID=2750947 RepID=UPI0018DBB3B4|nr:thioredoxin domain-containing protein [Bifidobacterium choladohabitans]MBI0047888.1 thioredoxin domain-containing protein [Bifidobacterium choladohabitans]